MALDEYNWCPKCHKWFVDAELFYIHKKWLHYDFPQTKSSHFERYWNE